jgi:tetratricopeptide (TPR) repeat protein
MIDEAQGRDDDAEKKYRELLVLNAGSAMARFRLANLMEKRGRYADAADQYRQLVENFGKPRFVAYDAVFCALALERAGKPAESAAWIKSYLSKVRGYAQWPVPYLRFLNGDIGEDELAKSADNGDPELARKGQCDLNYYLGMWSLLRKKDPAAARAYFQKSITSGLDSRMEYQKAKLELARLDSAAPAK